jgi:hypothetical protein
MRRKYIFFIFCVFAIASGCSDIDACPEEKLKETLKNEFESLYPKDSVGIVIACKSNAIFSEVRIPASLPTDVEYNLLLLSHIFYTLYKEENSSINSWVISINHNYDNSNIKKLFNEENSKTLLKDNTNIKYYKVTKLLLKNLSDYEIAYYNLGMEGARELFPGATLETDIVTLFTTYPFKDNRKFYSKEEAMKIEFELKLFYWISKFPYGSLEFDRKILDSLIEGLGINKEEEWNKEYLQKLYDEMVELGIIRGSSQNGSGQN